MSPPKALRARQRLGKYRIEKRLAEGGFAAVYRAFDTIEGIHVALKVPHPSLMTDAVLDDFRKEARLTARLDHPNILQLKNASFIDERFVIAFPLGEKSLAERMKKRMSLSTILDVGEQIIEAVAYAHSHRIIHCDIKPDNIILFPGNRIKLTDFGIAKGAMKKLRGSGTGTVGYMAPEQAMGRPTFRSDVFSVGLILYRMLAGRWPEYPFDWPPPGIAKLRRRATADFVDFLARSIDPNARYRYKDAARMQAVFKPLKPKVLRLDARRRARR
ncbi:MAG: serine/threonine-protein kinase [Planctomycetaceae bacterium]